MNSRIPPRYMYQDSEEDRITQLLEEKKLRKPREIDDDEYEEMFMEGE